MSIVKDELKDIMNTIPQMIWKVSVNEVGIITPLYFNEAWENYIGKNKNIFDESIVHPDDYLISKKAWDLGQKNFIFQTNRRLKDTRGNYNWFLTRAIYKNGYWYGTCTNIGQDIYKIHKDKEIHQEINKKIDEEINKKDKEIHQEINKKIDEEINKKDKELETNKENKVNLEKEIDKKDKELESNKKDSEQNKKESEQNKKDANTNKKDSEQNKKDLEHNKKESNKELKESNKDKYNIEIFLSNELKVLNEEKLKIEEKKKKLLKEVELLTTEKIDIEQKRMNLSKDSEILSKQKIDIEQTRIDLSKDYEILAKQKIEAEQKRINLSRDFEILAQEKIKVEEKRLNILLQSQNLAKDKIDLEKESVELLLKAELLSKEKIEYENNKIIKEILINKNLELVKIQQKDDEFLSFISHEIRNPVFAISSMIEFLKNTTLDDNQLEFVNIQEESCNIVLHLVNSILTQKKSLNKTDIQNKVFSINNIIKNVVNLSKYQIDKKSLELILDIPKEEYIVFGDYFKISQILLNLINNATKFTDSGSITISCQIFNENNSTYNVTISVTDTGIGIDNDKLDKLFKPFSQVNDTIQEKYGGYGLGLNICKKLMSLMNGTIGVESYPGKGSRFYINLLMLKPY
jgi:signal transduction histidine kinase